MGEEGPRRFKAPLDGRNKEASPRPVWGAAISMKAIVALTTLVLLGIALSGCTGSADEDTLGARMSKWYTDKPLGGGQQTPAHVFFEQPDGSFLFLHFNNDDVMAATELLFVGDALPGKFCKGAAGVTQAELSAGYVHFHKKSAANWDAGHGGGPSYAASQDGYWFRHIGAKTGSMQMMGQTMQVTKGEVFPLMPSDKVPECP